MSAKRYAEEFKVEAVDLVVAKGCRVADVAARLGISQYTLYRWLKERRVPAAEMRIHATQPEEVRRLEAELRRVIEERDILRRAAAYFAKQIG
jgi:transposase